MNQTNVIKGNPSKSFFIQMITRDISINDAIIDLLDNSIDAANKLNSEDYSHFFIRVTINKNEFIIEDNCGGFSLEIAKEYAFRFGRPDDAPTSKASVGRFGIGMKRALFKIGNDFIVESKTSKDNFKVQIDVPQWKIKTKNIEIEGNPIEIDDWDFNYSHINEDSSSLNENGTYIKVVNLHDEVSELFSENSFLSSLKKDMERLLNLSLEKKMKITLNGENLQSRNIQILFSNDDDGSKPFVSKDEKDGVTIKVIAGLGEIGDPSASGWYIYCNDRLVMEADRTEITGWGVSGIPKWHINHVMFRGIVFFDSDETIKLPLTTTKKGVDATSEIYKTALGRMKDAMRSTIAFLKEIPKLSEANEYRNLLVEKEEKISVTCLKSREWAHSKENFISPVLDLDSVARKKDSIRIAYNIDLHRANKAKNYSEASSYKELGEATFDYYYNMEDIENE